MDAGALAVLPHVDVGRFEVRPSRVLAVCVLEKLTSTVQVPEGNAALEVDAIVGVGKVECLADHT
eukprot:861050-Heterocapsa_arctica.AAC.1